MGRPSSHFRYGRPDSATAGGRGNLTQWWKKAKGVLHRVKYPFSSGLAPRAGLEPATSRLQVPRFFNRAWTISSPACKNIQGRVSGAIEALLDGFRSL